MTLRWRSLLLLPPPCCMIGFENSPSPKRCRLSDSNLILLAGRSAFRIYRGLLAKPPPVFADMLAAGSADATQTFDGCPVVHLPDHPH